VTDEGEIRALLARYWHYLDDRREHDWVDLFGDDVLLEYDDTVARSRTELIAIASQLKNYSGGKHLSSNELITIGGDEATAASDVMFVSPDERGTPTIRFYGRCNDTFRKTDAWRFTSRRITFQGGLHAP
jgi:hypothetical protein